MSQTYYVSFEVIPSDDGLVDKRIEEASAHCWIVEDDPVSAASKAVYHIRKSGWKIIAVEHPPTQVSLEHFKESDLGEKFYLEAQEFGIATCFRAYTPAKELCTEEPIRQIPKRELDMNQWLQSQHAIRSRIGCLFYAKTDTCHEIIDAHSIQKNGALSAVAREGLVYSVSTKLSDIRKNKGKLSLVKNHINSMSTFRGLCRHHDNLIFRPIDMALLLPTDEQVFLYAYRTVLRERFAKECAVVNYSEQLKSFSGTQATKTLFEGALEGNAIGLKSLRNHQSAFDSSHQEQNFDDIRYVVLKSEKAPTVVFSGSFYPDWGFNGEYIQNLYDLSKERQMITFSFAPTDTGWCFLFAWHKVSDAVCRHFISSLKTAMRTGKVVEDLLFGMVVKCCENTAFSPDWWENLPTAEKQKLEEAMTSGADPLKLIASDYLQTGIPGIHQWQFDSIQDNL